MARAAGAPLIVILRGERMPGTEDGPLPDCAWRGAEFSVSPGHHRPNSGGDGQRKSRDGNDGRGSYLADRFAGYVQIYLLARSYPARMNGADAGRPT